MKVGRLRDGGLRLDDVPPPAAGPGEVVVSLAACGVCGTDLEKIRGRYRTAGILGHEPAGVVLETGEGVSRVRAGDRVFVHHHVPCYACEVCKRGAWTFCPEYSRSNIDPGGFAEAFRVPRTHLERGAVLSLAPKVDWDVGALLEPAGCALTGLKAVGLRAGDTVFVLGLGPVGLLYARLAKALGAAWVGGSEGSHRRQQAALRGGADAVADPRDEAGIKSLVEENTHGLGVDLAVVATGAPSAVRLACELARRGGTVNLFGLPEPGGRLEADLQELYLRGIRIIPTYATTEPDIAEVHRRVANGSLRIGDLVSHRIPLDRIEEAFSLAARPEDALKVVVTGPASQ